MKTITIEVISEPEEKLAILLAEGEVFINNGWWDSEKGTWPKDSITVHVNCNDIFEWGSADAEDLKYSEIDELYEYYLKDPKWGTAAWCIKKRKQMPQKPVEEHITQEGIWDLKGLIK